MWLAINTKMQSKCLFAFGLLPNVDRRKWIDFADIEGKKGIVYIKAPILD